MEGLIEKYYIGFLNILGFLPVTGPGNYFVTILFQFIIVSPAIYLLYKKSPVIMLLSLFSIDFLFQLIAPHLNIFSEYPYLYSGCIFRYFSVIALGFYIHQDLIQDNCINLKKKNRFILICLPLSIIYLIAFFFYYQPFPLFSEMWGFQNIISFFYPLVLTILFLNLKEERFFKKNNGLLVIGRSSYHIFLFQILFFGFGFSFVNIFNQINAFVFSNYLFNLCIGSILNILFNVGSGLVFYYAEKYLRKMIKGKKRGENLI